jgi:hypothetical protein
VTLTISQKLQYRRIASRAARWTAAIAVAAPPRVPGELIRRLALGLTVGAMSFLDRLT